MDKCRFIGLAVSQMNQSQSFTFALEQSDGIQSHAEVSNDLQQTSDKNSQASNKNLESEWEAQDEYHEHNDTGKGALAESYKGETPTCQKLDGEKASCFSTVCEYG